MKGKSEKKSSARWRADEYTRLCLSLSLLSFVFLPGRGWPIVLLQAMPTSRKSARTQRLPVTTCKPFSLVVGAPRLDQTSAESRVSREKTAIGRLRNISLLIGRRSARTFALFLRGGGSLYLADRLTLSGWKTLKWGGLTRTLLSEGPWRGERGRSSKQRNEQRN